MKKNRTIRNIILSLLMIVLIGTLSSCGGTNKKTIPVTMEIQCQTAIDNGLLKEEKWQGVLPEDGVILAKTEVNVPEESTVFDVLLQVRDEQKIQMEYSGKAGNEYIKGIGNLYEFDGGRWSGWMYSVNGEFQNKGAGKVTVSEGDKICFVYTCDLGMDIGANMDEAQEWKDTHE